jgi:hypothetical protein
MLIRMSNMATTPINRDSCANASPLHLILHAATAALMSFRIESAFIDLAAAR